MGRIGVWVAVFLLLFTALEIFLVQSDVFEKLYQASRKHEDWELDEIVLAGVALSLSVSVTAGGGD